MAPLPVEKRFAVLCEIVRAQHFAWRQAVAELCPEVDPEAVADRMWEITGADTGRAYARHLEPLLAQREDQPLALMLAQSVAWSSQCMGEAAEAQPATDGVTDEAFVRHADCPWYHWHERQGLLAEDRPGCDAWFESTVKTLSGILGRNIRFETLASLPDGDECCRRRFWVEET